MDTRRFRRSKLKVCILQESAVVTRFVTSLPKVLLHRILGVAVLNSLAPQKRLC